MTVGGGASCEHAFGGVRVTIAATSAALAVRASLAASTTGASAPARDCAYRKAVERPIHGDRRANAKLTLEREETVSGTIVAKNVDGSAVARVAQCSRCDRVAELQGDPARLWALGWGSRRNTALPRWPRIWFCVECWQVEVPRLVAEGRPSMLDPAKLGRLLEISRMRAHATKRLQLVDLIKRLLAFDPDCGEAMLRTIVYAAERKTAARQWRALLPAEQRCVGAEIEGARS